MGFWEWTLTYVFFFKKEKILSSLYGIWTRDIPNTGQ